MKVALAGPLSNFGLTAAFTICGILLGLFLSPTAFLDSPVLSYLLRIIALGIQINLLLAVFNLIPVPPLDGSHILRNVLSPSARMAYEGSRGTDFSSSSSFS